MKNEVQRKLLTAAQREKICETYKYNCCLGCPLTLPLDLAWGKYQCFKDIDAMLRSIDKYMNGKVEVSE